MLFVKLLVAAATGLLSHVLIFIRGEYHTKIPKIVSIYSVLALLVSWNERNTDPASGSRKAASIICSHFLALFGSITVYRIFLHPLRSFPGPPLAKVSKLWHVKNVYARQNHLFLEKMRRTYGNFVRIGKMPCVMCGPDAMYNTRRSIGAHGL